jgi:hypothetical protein
MSTTSARPDTHMTPSTETFKPIREECEAAAAVAG